MQFVNRFLTIATATLCFALPGSFHLANAASSAPKQATEPALSTIPQRIEFIVDGCHEYKVTKAQCAYILATVEWETAGTWLPVREAFWMGESWRQRNLRYYPWYGRGYVQLTWQRNYSELGKLLGYSLTQNPDLVLDPIISRHILFYGTMNGTFTGYRLGQFVINSLTYSVQARRVINGLDKAHVISDRAHFWFRNLTVY